MVFALMTFRHSRGGGGRRHDGRPLRGRAPRGVDVVRVLVEPDRLAGVDKGEEDTQGDTDDHGGLDMTRERAAGARGKPAGSPRPPVAAGGRGNTVTVCGGGVGRGIAAAARVVWLFQRAPVDL